MMKIFPCLVVHLYRVSSGQVRSSEQHLSHDGIVSGFKNVNFQLSSLSIVCLFQPFKQTFRFGSITFVNDNLSFHGKLFPFILLAADTMNLIKGNN